ncbi:unnamed protein product [Colletotrichum noveboracense]|uniref:Heterokaryon incompatibility domain-containing protein n=1 Tax=Colletotrichum noveboracense TaxID=2664923 RepID=A0A9W4WGS4_9PEZI|nr:unnamed protein product [Colletotrichum noveboracense]
MKNSTIPPDHPSVALSATDTNSSAFHDIYSQLPHSDSVRILILLPADDPDAELQGTLSTTRLSDCQNEDTSYVTLSYVWGQQKHTGLVRIDERYLQIGENLFDALRHLRRRDKSLRLWADALCINQFNLEERNHQVQNMRDIYASSTETVIYLGNDDGGTTNLSAWNLLERLSIWALNDQGNKDFDRPSKLQQSLTKFKGSIEDVEIAVLSQPWFSRVWVLQEVVVSKAVSIQCGPRGIPWNDFCKIILLQPRSENELIQYKVCSKLDALTKRPIISYTSDLNGTPKFQILGIKVTM